MSALLLVPLLLPELDSKPSRGPLSPFHLSVYTRNGWLKGLSSNGNEKDLVLDRVLGTVPEFQGDAQPDSLKASDSILLALTKLNNLITWLKQRKITSAELEITGSLDLKGNRITNLSTPVDDKDAVSKEYYHAHLPVPRELVNTVISFQVGEEGFPGLDATTYSDARLVGKEINLYREGERMTPGDTSFGYAYNATTGTVTFYPALYTGERIVIHALLAAQVGSGSPGGGGADLTEVYTRLQELAASIEQGPLVISSFNSTTTLAESGSTLQSVTLNWGLSKNPESLSITPTIGAVAPSLRSVTRDLNLTANTTFTLTALIAGISKTATTSITFGHRYYFGVNEASSLSAAGIQALASNPLATSRSRSINLNGGGKYLYIAYPASWGAATFTMNGLVNTAWVMTTQDITNAFGVTLSYRVYRSQSLQNATSIPLQIS